MKAEGSDKHEHIVEAAIKRFSHFGINKTTLGEIADDIGISKPSLFYYFNDKSCLLDAVGKKIVNGFFEELEAALSYLESVDESLLQFIEVKRRYFKKYLLLALQADSLEMNKVSSPMPEVIVEARKRTDLVISNLLKRGIEQKVLKPVDTAKTASLLLDTLDAFELCMKSKTAPLASKNIDDLFDKQRDVVQLLLNGLKSDKCGSEQI